MQIKIGNKIYDSNKEPVMLILSNTEAEVVAFMKVEAKGFLGENLDSGAGPTGVSALQSN